MLVTIIVFIILFFALFAAILGFDALYSNGRVPNLDMFRQDRAQVLHNILDDLHIEHNWWSPVLGVLAPNIHLIITEDEKNPKKLRVQFDERSLEFKKLKEKTMSLKRTLRLIKRKMAETPSDACVASV